MKLKKLLANLGYGSRREVEYALKDGRVTAGDVELDDHYQVRFNDADKVSQLTVDFSAIRFDGKALDPAPGVVLVMNKPLGYTCSTRDPGQIVYDLMPRRFRVREPVISPVGRLDRMTTGLLLLTDDGQLLHKITSPRKHVAKRYHATLAQDLRGNETQLFAAGTLLLEGETEPLRPAELEVIGAREVRLTLHEGRYHQVRRMFAATGNHVETLHREAIGALALPELEAGQWRELTTAELASVFAG